MLFFFREKNSYLQYNTIFLYLQANVVCRQLGFTQGAESFDNESPYGPVSDIFSYDEVQCTGQETTLDSCPHANTEDCFGTEAVGVVCVSTDPRSKIKFLKS